MSATDKNVLPLETAKKRLMNANKVRTLPRATIGKLAKTRKRGAQFGAIGEYLVGCDLMARGHEVFKPLSPDAPCDLVVLRPGSRHATRIQVKSRRSNGVWEEPTSRHADVLAMVDFTLREPEIFYVDVAPVKRPQAESARATPAETADAPVEALDPEMVAAIMNR